MRSSSPGLKRRLGPREVAVDELDRRDEHLPARPAVHACLEADRDRMLRPSTPQRARASTRIVIGFALWPAR